MLRDDRRSRLSRLIHRQLAVAGRCSIDQLAAGVLRAQPDLQQAGSLIYARGRYQPTLRAVDGDLAPAPGTDTRPWSTQVDLILIEACGPAGARYRDVSLTLIAAGRTPGGAHQQVWRSPILRRTARRGYYVLVGDSRQQPPTAATRFL